nr:hypothetical protein GCM10020093_083370 [Planobispora longispora]
MRRAVPLLFSFVVPIAVLMWTLAHPLIGLLYGVKWDQSAGVLRFLVVLMVVRMLTALAFDILTSVGATKSTVWLNLGWGRRSCPRPSPAPTSTASAARRSGTPSPGRRWRSRSRCWR